MPGKGNANTGSDSGEAFIGSSGDDSLRGSRFDDWFEGGAGDDRINGKSGFDTAVYSGDVRDYVITNGGRVLISGPDGNDILNNIEALQFDNTTVYLDGRNNTQIVDDAVVSVNEDGEVVSINVFDTAWDFENDALSVINVDASGFDGTVTFDPATGEFTFDVGEAYQSLNDGESVDVDVSFQVSDGVNVTDHTITVTINGADEEAGVGTSDWVFLGDGVVNDARGITLSAGGPNQVSDAEGEAFLNFDGTLDAFAGGDATDGALAKMTLTLTGPATLSFSFDFSGSDEFSGFFKDFAFITINGEPIMLEQFPGTIGDQTFSIELEAGTYEIGFGAFDYLDSGSSPTLIIENFQITESEATSATASSEFMLSPETLASTQSSDESADDSTMVSYSSMMEPMNAGDSVDALLGSASSSPAFGSQSSFDQGWSNNPLSSGDLDAHLAEVSMA